MILVLATAAAALASLAVLALPGLPLALGLRMHPLARAAVLTPLSIAVVTVAAEGCALLGIPWNPVAPLLLGLLAGAPLLWRRRTELRDLLPAARDRLRGSATAAVIAAGMVLGGMVTLVRALVMMGSIDAVSQTYDAVFHLNAVRWVLDTGSASAWSVSTMTAMPGAAGTFYPSAWHQLASLVVMLSGGDIVLGSNVLMLVLAVLVWPVGLVALVRLCTSAGRLGLFLAGALSGVSSAFPLMLMSWGIVWPNFLSTVLLPPLILLGAHLVGLVPEARERIGLGPLLGLLALSGLAVALSHPQGVFAVLLLAVPAAAWAAGAHLVALRRAAGPDPSRRGLLVRALVVLVLLTAIAVVIWPRLRPSQSSAVWGPYTDHAWAFLEAISLAGTGGLPVVAVGLAMVAAIAGVLLRGQGRWLLPAFAASSAVFMVSASVWDMDLRYAITGNWYSDTYRIAAIPVAVGVPILALGLDSLAGLLTGRLRRPGAASPAAPGARAAAAPRQEVVRIGPRLLTRGRHERAASDAAGPATAARPAPVRPALALAAVLAVLAGTALVSLGPSGRFAHDQAALNWTRYDLLTPDEKALLELVPEYVPEDAVIAVNPWNGGALAYAISDRQVLSRFMGFEAPEEVHLLNRALDEADEDPEVCEAAHELNVEYALDFGPRELFERRATYVGLNEISTGGAAEVVAQVGEAKLLRIKPCTGTDGSMLG